MIYRVLGKIHQQQADVTAALEDYGRSVATLQELNQEFDLGMTLIDYAQALRHNGDTVQAKTRLAEALAIFDRLDLPAEIARVTALLEQSD